MFSTCNDTIFYLIFDTGFSPWSNWTSCSESCQQSRNRTCLNPTATMTCNDTTNETRPCNNTSCQGTIIMYRNSFVKSGHCKTRPRLSPSRISPSLQPVFLQAKLFARGEAKKQIRQCHWLAKKFVSYLFASREQIRQVKIFLKPSL